MIKFKVGDNVKIRKDIEEDDNFISKYIKSLGGKIATITSIDDNENYRIDLDDGDFVWFDEDFEEIPNDLGKITIENNLENIAIPTEGTSAIFKTVWSIPIQVRYIDKNLTKMEKIDKGDLVDLRVSKVKVNGEEKDFPCTYKFGDTVFFKLGFSLKLPQGYKANVYPRSSTFKNYGLLLTNSVGQIDNSYSGNEDEWCAMFYATREGTIDYNDRVLQFEIAPQQMNNINFKFVEELDETNRGGYGSTGTK